MVEPLGRAGLLKIPPRDGDLTDALEQRVAELDLRLGELDATIEADRAALRGLRAQALSLRAHEYAQVLATRRMAEVAESEAQLNQTIATRTALSEERRTHLATLSQPMPAEGPQAHIGKPHTPYRHEQERRARFLKLWAAVSTPLLLSSIVVVLLASPLAWITTLAVLIVIFAGVEAIARRRLLSFVASLLLLAAAAALIIGLTLLFIKHWRTAISVLLGAAALVLLFGNLEELRRG